MAVFYHANRTTPGTIRTIDNLEDYPSRRPTTKPQFLDVMADGTRKHQGLGDEVQEIIININLLSEANRDVLIAFIENTCGWANETFDFDDDQGNEYNNCFFAFNKHDFEQRFLGKYNWKVRIITGPAVASPSPSESPSVSPSVSPSPSPSSTPSVSPSSTPSVSPSNSPSASPSTSVSPSASPSTSPSPSASPSVSVSPSSSPSVSPSASPSVSPSVSPSASPSPPVSEDLTTYTEVDPNGHIAVISSKSTFTDLTEDEEAYIYKSFGVDNFGNFEIRCDVRATSDVGEAVVLGVSNTIGDYGSWGSVGLGVYFDEFGGQHSIRLSERGGSTDIFDMSLGTTYYLIFKRVGTACTLKVYSDSARTTLLDTLSLTVETTAYKYLYVTASMDNAGEGIIRSGYTENVDIISP